MPSPWSDGLQRCTWHSHHNADAAVPCGLNTHTPIKHNRFYKISRTGKLYFPLTIMSWHSHTDHLPVAVPSVERIISYSRGLHGQLSISFFASFVLHLWTEWLHHHSDLISPKGFTGEFIYSFIISEIHPSIHLFSCSLNTPYLNNHIKICPKYRVRMFDWQLQFSWFCYLIWPRGPTPGLFIHFSLLLRSCGENVGTSQLILV